MYIFNKIFMIILLILIIQILNVQLLNAVIIVDDEELSDDQIISKEPLFGYRKISNELFDLPKDRSAIPASVFIESAKALPWVNKIIQQAGKDPTKVSLNDWYNASKSASLGNISREMPSKLSAHVIPGYQLIVDPSVIIGLSETELFENHSAIPYTAPFHGHRSIKWIPVNDVVFKNLTNSYMCLSNIKRLPPNRFFKSLNIVRANLSTYPLVEKALILKSGQVTFGEPVVNHYSEKELEIPISIISEYNVFWVELRLTYHIATKNIEKLFFNVMTPSGVTALELLPLRFDKELEQTRIISSPEIRIKSGSNTIELGKIYKQQVVFKTLRPLIIAYGLGESEFSWELLEDAVCPGSHKFIVLLKVSKEKKSVSLYLQAGAITKKYLIQGDLLITKPVITNLELKVPK